MEKKLYPDLMIDLETLGNTDHSAIVQIGACYFDMKTGEIGEEFCMDIDIDDACKYGVIDASTVVWWLNQSKEAQISVFGPNVMRQYLKIVLKAFTCRMSIGVEDVWCHTDFDWVILQNAYKAVGLQFPFKFWQRKDLRTITKLADVSTKDYVNDGVAHNALDDCKFQVKYTVGCYNKLRGEVWQDLRN